MAIAALSVRSSTRYRAGRRPLPGSLLCPAKAGQEQAPLGACDRKRGTWPAAPLAALPALNDVPHRPAAVALSVSPETIRETYRYLPEARLAGVAAHIQFEGRP